MKKPSEGRKPDQKKDQVVLVRVTEDHKKAFAGAAKHVGMDLSTWMRALAVAEARKLKYLD